MFDGSRIDSFGRVGDEVGAMTGVARRAVRGIESDQSGSLGING